MAKKTIKRYQSNVQMSFIRTLTGGACSEYLLDLGNP